MGMTYSFFSKCKTSDGSSKPAPQITPLQFKMELKKVSSPVGMISQLFICLDSDVLESKILN